MSLRNAKPVARDSFDLISVDIFDTVLLRDHTVQRSRFLEVARSLAKKLHGQECQTNVRILLDLRRQVQDLAYRAVAIERPDGDVTLTRMVEIQASLLGLDKATAPLFIAAELEIERRRLAPNRPLCQFLEDQREYGKRVIAISDTFLSVQNLENLISDLVPNSPIEKIYSSSELGLTKRSGKIFEQVAALENVPLGRIVHCGDDRHSDFDMARAAGCLAVHLPRSAWVRFSRRFSAMQAFFNGEIG